MLSRKDYIGLCNALADGVHTGQVIPSLCAWLAKGNPRFDEEKFKTFLGTLVAKRKTPEEVVF